MYKTVTLFTIAMFIKFINVVIGNKVTCCYISITMISQSNRLLKQTFTNNYAMFVLFF